MRTLILRDFKDGIIMGIFKKNNRKNGKIKRLGRDRIIRKEERNEINKRYPSDERGDFGNQSGLYYRLPKNKQDTIMSIIAVLEGETDVHPAEIFSHPKVKPFSQTR